MTWASASWRALGTYVQLVVADADVLEPAREVATGLLERVDRTCSRFRDGSDLVRANARAGTWTAVDPLLVDALRAALRAAADSGGLVDPTLGADLARLGYDDDLDAVRARTVTPSGPADLGRPVRTAGWQDVEVRDDAVRVPAGLALDLGATGKAWAADRVAEAVRDATGTALAVSLGGDVATAAPAGHPAAGVGWPVHVAERPGEAPQDRAVLVAGTGAAALATSSTLARRWAVPDGPGAPGPRTVHHLLDPRTGSPVPGTYRTVSVAAPTCLRANTASTAALVLGAQAPGWLAARGLGARLVAADGTVEHVGGWPA